MKFVQEREIFAIAVLGTSEKCSDSVFLGAVRSFCLDGCVQSVEAREDSVMVLVHQHTSLCEVRRGASFVSQKE